jgi:hypothetical protein
MDPEGGDGDYEEEGDDDDIDPEIEELAGDFSDELNQMNEYLRELQGEGVTHDENNGCKIEEVDDNGNPINT